MGLANAQSRSLFTTLTRPCLASRGAQWRSGLTLRVGLFGTHTYTPNTHTHSTEDRFHTRRESSTSGGHPMPEEQALISILHRTAKQPSSGCTPIPTQLQIKTCLGTFLNRNCPNQECVGLRAKHVPVSLEVDMSTCSKDWAMSP